MNKPLSLFVVLALFLSACGAASVPPVETSADVTVGEVFLSENSTLKFFFEVTRAGVTEAGTAEAPIKYIEISGADDRDPESGTLCNSAGTTPVCEIAVDQYAQPYLVKVTYDDSTYSVNEVSVPVPEFMEMPTIVAPTSTPAQESDFSLSFKGVGADSYEVRVHNCNQYQNDGINPCLFGDIVNISMESGVPEISREEGGSVYQPSVELKDGVITVRSSFKISFEDSVEYTVTATGGNRTMSDSVTLR